MRFKAESAKAKQVDSGFSSAGGDDGLPRGSEKPGLEEDGYANVSRTLVVDGRDTVTSATLLDVGADKQVASRCETTANDAAAVAVRLWRRQTRCPHVLKLPYEYFYKQDVDGDTRLHEAIALGYVEASLWLIELAPHPCLLDLANDGSITALHLAAMAGEARIARGLILAGADPRLVTFTGNTALHLACARGDLNCVKALTRPFTGAEQRYSIARGSRKLPLRHLELWNYNGETCLHIAASRGHVDVVAELLHAGADAEAREGLSGKTALHLALENGHLEVVRLLARERRSCLDATTYAGYTSQQLAAQLDCRLAEDLEQLQLRCEPEGRRFDGKFELAATPGPSVASPLLA